MKSRPTLKPKLYPWKLLLLLSLIFFKLKFSFIRYLLGNLLYFLEHNEKSSTIETLKPRRTDGLGFCCFCLAS